MKNRKYQIILVLFLTCIFSKELSAQQDSIKVKFSEETAVDQKKRNLKWVGINPKRLKLDNVFSMMKIGVSTFSSISELRIIDVEAGYQYKIKGTQLSIEGRIRVPLRFNDIDGQPRFFPNRIIVGNEQIGRVSRNITSLDIILRYQLFKTRAIGEKKSGNNLYGLYVFAGGLNVLSWQKRTEAVFRNDITNRQPIRVTEERGLFTDGILGLYGIGFQQRILKKGYIDITGGVIELNDNVHQRYRYFIQLSLGYSIFKVKK